MMMTFADWLTSASNYVHAMMLMNSSCTYDLRQVGTKDDHERLRSWPGRGDNQIALSVHIMHVDNGFVGQRGEPWHPYFWAFPILHACPSTGSSTLGEALWENRTDTTSLCTPEDPVVIVGSLPVVDYRPANHRRD